MRFAWMALALALAAGDAQALGLAGFTLGRSLTDAQRAEMADMKTGMKPCASLACTKSVQISGAEGAASVFVSPTGTIWTVRVMFDAAAFDRVASDALRQYGRPQFADSGLDQDSSSPKYTGRILSWAPSGEDVMLIQHCSAAAEACLRVSDVSLMKK